MYFNPLSPHSVIRQKTDYTMHYLHNFIIFNHNLNFRLYVFIESNISETVQIANL